MNRSGRSPASTRRACVTCGSVYAETEWQSLRVAQRIAADEVRHIVLDWPAELCVEVRLCGRCGRAMAAKRAVG